MTSESANWPTINLGDLCTKIGSGATPKGGKDSYLREGTALVRSQNVLDFEFSEAGLARISDDAAAKLANVKVEPDDVLLNITGDSVARCCLAPKWLGEARVNQHVMIIRPGRERLSFRFLNYFLLAQKPHLLTLSRAGATRPALTKLMIETLEIPLPSLLEQNRIAWVLGSLDDKIELNKRIEQVLLEVLASEWRNANTRGGRVPISSMASAVRDTVQPYQTPEVLFEQFSIPAFDQGAGPEVCAGASMASGKTRLPSSGAVLVSKLNPGTWRAWHAKPRGVAVPVCSPEFVALVAEDPEIYLWVAGVALFDPGFRSEVLTHATGTTGSRQRIRPGDLLACGAPSPSAQQRRLWANKAGASLELVHQLIQERQILADLRDELLPRLISGQIRVPEGVGPDADVTDIAREMVEA